MVTHKTDIFCFLKIYFNIYQVHPVNVYWPFIEYLMKIFLSKYLNENMRRQLILNTGWWFIKIFNSPSFVNTWLLINLFYGFQSFSSVFDFQAILIMLVTCSRYSTNNSEIILSTRLWNKIFILFYCVL